MNDANARYEMFLRDKAKMKWIKEGETNSKYLHSRIRARRVKNQIKDLKDDNRGKHKDPDQIASNLVAFVVGKFTEGQTNFDPKSTSTIKAKILHAKNEDIMRIPVGTEIHECLMYMNPDSSPEPDSFRTIFF